MKKIFRHLQNSFIAMTAFLVTGSAHGGLIANWKADTYVSGANWTDSAAATPIVATQRNSPIMMPNAFGSHQGVDLSGGKYFTVAAARNPLAGKSSFTLAAVFRATAPGAAGVPWYTASGLIGMEQGGVVNDFGFGWSGSSVKAGLGIAGSTDPTVTSPSVATNATHAAVFTYGAGVLTLFVDGQQVATTSSAAAAGRNASDFALGAITSGGLNPFPGIIAELQIYDTVEDGAALSASLLSTYVPPRLITSYTADKATAFEGDAVQLSWTIDTAPTTGNISVVITRGATTIHSASAASGSISTNIPSLAGAAQQVVYTLTVTEIGGSGAVNAADVVIEASPGIPTATSQGGLVVTGTNPLNITLAGNDPNGGSLSYSVVRPPAHGALSGSGTALIYVAESGYFGADNFAFKVNDGAYDSLPATVSLTVDAPPTAPGSIALSRREIADTKPAGAWIANISSADVNVGDPHTFTLVSGTGSTDNARFSINGHQLLAAEAMSFPAGTRFSIRLRSTDGSGLFTEETFDLTVIRQAGRVVINEVLYNGVDNTVLDDFIELYNSGSTPVNLTGWRLSGAVDYSFPPNTTIDPGAYLLIADTPATILEKWGKTALGPWTGNLRSDGETIRLRDAADTVVSDVDYRPGFPWPVVSDGEGTSMELINPSLDESHGSNWKPSVIPPANATSDVATPGAQNTQFAANAAPAIREVHHTPVQPTSSEAIVVTATITDPNGVASAQLLYQAVAPGGFIPSTLPKTISGGQFTNIAVPLAPNPAFEDPANWTTLEMNDEGLGADTLGGDGIWSASIPPQVHRTLVRYRIVVADNLGISARVPYADDKSLNFACFVYNGVPDYQGTPASALTSLPTYHFLTRQADYLQSVAYNASFRLTPNTPSWTFENWEAAFVYDGIVYDHIRYRLHGANGRYTASGVPGAASNSKRAFKFLFNKGYLFAAKDQTGAPYPAPWSTMITEGGWENRATYTFSLNELVSFHLWNALGVPSPLGHSAHFRTIMQPLEQPDPWHGDFWGLMYVHEDHDNQFLQAHDLADGNLYKLTKDNITGLSQQRHQAPFAPKDGSDHDQLHNTLRGTSTPAFITGRVNFDLWARYHAFAEAIRHYDYWPSGDNNAAWYFEPIYDASNNNKGILWVLPNDVDATWGPTWNNGHDRVHDSIFNDASSTGGDAATNPSLWPRYYNQVREVRDLLFQPDQINPLIDEFAASIQPFVNADFARWFGAPNDAGNYNGLVGPGTSSSVGQTSLAAYVADMKDFAFDPNNNGGVWPGAGNIGVGGRAAFMDRLQAMNGEGTQLPVTPTISYAGAAAYPVNDLRFSSSSFADPQGAESFGGMQWRIAEITDPSAPAYVPGERFKLEIDASYDSGELATFASEFRFPAAAARAGHSYRARVRHKDATGRWSHWSAPVQFTAGAADISVFTSGLVISELMYHPVEPTSEEAALGYAEEDFEYLEIRNRSDTAIDLTDVRLTRGVNFDFPAGLILTPGASILVVGNLAAFNLRYGAGKPIAGQWEAGDLLSNGGEDLRLSYGAGAAIIDLIYDDAWHPATDGGGQSLVVYDQNAAQAAFSTAANWRPSATAGGSPGSDEPAFVTTLAATAITATSVQLHASLLPNGSTTTPEFVVAGVRHRLPNVTGNAPIEVEMTVDGLSPHTLYAFRAEATSAAGVRAGDEMSFTTLNRLPIASDKQFHVPARTAFTLDVLGSDCDPDHDLLTITAVTQGQFGAAAIDGRQLLYTPGAGFLGTDTFTYTITDGFGGLSSATVALRNTAPVAGSDIIASDGGAVTFDPRVNDTDADNDVLTIASVAPGAGGSVAIVGAGITYTPGSQFSGRDVFSYTVTDGVASSSATVSVQSSKPIAVVNVAQGAPVPGQPDGTTYESFGLPTSGAFSGTVRNGTGPAQHAIFAADGTVLLKVGDPAPEVPGATIAKLSEPSGQAVLATLRRGGAVTAKNDTVLYAGLTDGALRIAAREGDAFGGATVKRFQSVDGNGATVFFLANLAGASVSRANDVVLGAEDIDFGARVLVREGDLVGAKPVTLLATLVAARGTLAEGRWRAGAEAIGVRLSFRGQEQALYTIPATATSPADWTLWADTTQGLLGPGKQKFGLPAFGAESVAATVAVSKDIALLRATASGNVLLARKGSPVPGLDGAMLPGLTFQKFGDPVSGTGGRTAFAASVAGPGVSKADQAGLWLADDNGEIRMLARSGDPAPGGGRWTLFESLALPDGAPSGPLFTAKLVVDGAEGVGAGNDRGLWGVDSSGVLQLLLRTGQVLIVNDLPQTIESFVALAPAPGSFGAAHGFDDDQHVMVLATFIDHSQAVVTLTVP